MIDIDLNKRRWIIIFIFITFMFGVISRLYWIDWASDYPEMIHDGQVMINTNDGYAFAEGARDIIAGFHQPNDLSYVNHTMSKFTAFIYHIVPFSFETIILYMSVFFSSLLVVPVLLIAREFRVSGAGIVAAASSVVAVSYYNRTMAGYYDTDMLNIVLPCFVLWGLIRITVRQDRFSIIIAPIFGLFYHWWYPSSFTLIGAMAGMFLLYTLIFERKSLQNYQALLLLIVAVTNLSATFRLISIIALYLLFMKKEDIKVLAAVGALVLLVFILKGGLNPIWFMLKFYVVRDTTEALSSSFHFFSVNQTIQESGAMDWDYFMTRISSHPFFFILGAIGYLLFCFKHRAFLISLPILALGILSIRSGLRFTIYAVPIMALGLGFLVNFLLDFFKVKGALKLSGIVALTVVAVFPALKHIKNYTSPTVFFNAETQVLERLKSISDREDYVVAWWDYGYPIRYYADVKTLIDGGKHLGNHNFPVSFALTKDIISSANMSRLSVEYTEKAFNDKNISSPLKAMMKDYGFDDPNLFLTSLSLKDFALPQKTRDIYYYLPARMIGIYSVVWYFSNIDLTTGKGYDQPYFASARFVQVNNSGLVLDNGMTLSTDMKNIIYGSQSIPIRGFYETRYDESGKFSVSEIIADKDGILNVIILSDGTFIITDNKAFNSAYVQLFMLERYDSEIYELVISTPLAKVYKLKI